jgi:hypothetical protein
MSPTESDDLTKIIEEDGGVFWILRSRDTAEHDPAYEKVASFTSMDQAETFLQNEG